MDWVKNITDILDMISGGIDPSTGEIIDVEELKNASEFQSALKKLNLTYRKTSSGGVYAQFEAAYPNYAIIMTEGYFFSAHNKSAFVLNRVLQYKMALDYYKRPSTGGPNYEKISAAFQEEGISFLLVSKGELVEQFSGEDPFEKYGINDDDCAIFVSEEMKEFFAEDDLRKPMSKKSSPKPQSYPQNILKELLPGQDEFPSDIAARLSEVLTSERVFSQRYRRDAECISKHYEDGRTLENIGTDYSLTRERIRQLIKRGLKKMSRKAVLSYLEGNTEFLEIPVSRTADIKSSEKQYSIPDNLPPVSDEAISISMLARNISGQMLDGKTLHYADIMSWLISVGDLVKTEENSAIITVPTEQGIAHGIKRGKRMNSAGVEYIGLFLDPDAQEYISGSLSNILSFLGDR